MIDRYDQLIDGRAIECAYQACPRNRISLSQTIGSGVVPYFAGRRGLLTPNGGSVQSTLILDGSGIERSGRGFLLSPNYCFGGEVAGGPPVG
jgi:hypothetical protein